MELPRTVGAVLLVGWLVAGGSFLHGQSAADLRSLLERRVGDLSRLQVPADDADLPQPRLPDGTLDPRFAITPEKVRLGKLLFFDPVRSNHIRVEFGGLLETAQTGSCGSCHMGDTATKAGAVISVSVGGVGRHEMDYRGHKTIHREIMEGAVDVLPTGLEQLDEGGTVVASGLFDAVDAPGRVAPSVIGFAFNNRLLWGGAAGEPNAEGYPAQEDIVRIASMAHRMANPDVAHLRENAVYRRLFADAFPPEATSGNPEDFVNLDTQFRAIAAFLRTVVTRNTPWDRFLAGDDAALTPAQLRGAMLFAAPVGEGGANCIACHSGPALNKTLGDEEGNLVAENFHNLGTLEHPLQDLARTALGDPDHHDAGRSDVTGDPARAYQFKAPTLRQLRDGAPFFHGGEAATLREAVEYLLRGEPANPLAAAAGTLSPLFTHPRGEGTRGIDLTESQVRDLVEFLDGGLYDRGLVMDDPGSPTRIFELGVEDLTYSAELKALGAVDGWLPSGLPNGFNDDLSRQQLIFVRGSTGNGDDVIDVSDAIHVINYLLLGGLPPVPMVSGDINDDRGIDISDPIYLLNFLFLGGPAPPAPYPEPGQDLTP